MCLGMLGALGPLGGRGEAAAPVATASYLKPRRLATGLGGAY